MIHPASIEISYYIYNTYIYIRNTESWHTFSALILFKKSYIIHFMWFTLDVIILMNQRVCQKRLQIISRLVIQRCYINVWTVDLSSVKSKSLTSVISWPESKKLIGAENHNYHESLLTVCSLKYFVRRLILNTHKKLKVRNVIVKYDFAFSSQFTIICNVWTYKKSLHMEYWTPDQTKVHERTQTSTALEQF